MKSLFKTVENCLRDSVGRRLTAPGLAGEPFPGLPERLEHLLRAAAVPAARQQDDDGRRGAAAVCVEQRLDAHERLDRLIEVDVEGLSGAGDDHRRRPDERRHPEVPAQKVDQLHVGLFRVAGGHGDRPGLAVEGHIDDEVEPRQPGGGEHLLVDRVALQDPRPCRGGGEHVEGVVADDGLVAGDRGQDRLAAAGEAGELVGLDLAEGDSQVGLGYAPVQKQRHAARGAADGHEVVGPGVVIGHSQPGGPLAAE